MPRIPVRTTPYHTLPRCTRHYKSKRDLILRALGKASFINGSQFVIAWISPKGEVDVYASELLQTSVSNKEGGILCRKELDREATRVKGEMGRRWEDIRRLEESGEAPSMEDDEAQDETFEEDDMDVDPDRTMVDDDDSMKKTLQGLGLTAPRPNTPASSMHTLTLAPDATENYYTSRFAALQQATCKLVVKAWIKVIEPKKQMKFPYNKGEELKPLWWPEGVRHREPDHLSKTERLTLLTSIVRSPLVTVSRLELSTAEAAAFISRPRLAVLREVYLVAKEEERKRKEGDLSPDLVVQLPNIPISPSDVSPEASSEKRSHAQFEASISMADKENVPSVVHQKRLKTQPLPRLAPLVASQSNTSFFEQPAFYAQNVQPYLSPYPSEFGYAGSDYGRSPNPEMGMIDRSTYPSHPGHLAPLLNHSHTHSPVDSPAFPQSATLAPPNSASAFYTRGSNGPSYMQQQQVEYLQSHAPGYDYGSPYLADNAWEGSFAQPV
ncbi:hypothetical protein BD324DRAFT_244629 [Kockovaella imperatae]|uniref:Subtelomeric hrmA-associated cluster protein AFUB-079030/YDR124W-like helical bundle domain-containing protein n=1 Tax=Kockovaella imperatae TaxID=4999 RepID=A0A1Y1UPI9_9TREE|nr:hypothetical protein BD324DRAFT_244629 [Kockovaella imperatae]ORX39933.1 hypothetical protein BD324DRAFT_244629 [Kockovaella imperatae]